MKKVNLFIFVLFNCVFLQFAVAQSSPEVNTPENVLFNELVGQLDFVEGRLASLAEAVPEDKYSWSPAEGVRSVGEIYAHAAGANYFILSFLGGKMPEGFNPDEKAVIKKDELIKMLKDSFEYAKNYVPTIKEEDLDKEVELPFGKFTQRTVLFILITHGHEHLGQSIAYARMNGVTPPWSRGEY